MEKEERDQEIAKIFASTGKLPPVESIKVVTPGKKHHCIDLIKCLKTLKKIISNELFWKIIECRF